MRLFWILGKKASLCKGSQAGREKLSFVLHLAVEFTGLQAARRGEQQHRAEAG